MSQHDGKRPSPPTTTVKNLGRLSHRALTLAELQMELLKVDVKESLAGAIGPLALLLGGGVIALSSATVLLMAVARAFREWGGLSGAASYFAAAGVGLAFAAVAVAAGWVLLRKALAVFDRSKGELRKNVTWLKRALKNDLPEDRDGRRVP